MNTKYETKDPEVVYAAIKNLATQELSRGATRLSVRKLLEVVRGQLKCRINNNEMSAITDRLRAESVAFKNAIETRARGVRGKNVNQPANNNASLDARVEQWSKDSEIIMLKAEIEQLRSDRDFLIDLMARTTSEAV